MKSGSFHFEGQRSAKKKSISPKSDRTFNRKLTDARAQLTADHPEANVAHIVNGIVRRGLKPLPTKAGISLRMDADVLEWFKAQGPGYQTRINAVLRAFRDASLRLRDASR